jgi:hypothetical protein
VPVTKGEEIHQTLLWNLLMFRKHFFENRTNKFLGDQFLPKMDGTATQKMKFKKSGPIDVSVVGRVSTWREYETFRRRHGFRVGCDRRGSEYHLII